MSIELKCLLWSAIVALLYLNVQALFFRRQVGIKNANENRDDEPVPDLYTGRATRALRNFLETYAVFIALVVVASFGKISNAYTQYGAMVWLGARVLYLPLYVAGLSPWRSIVWTISFAALIAMIIGLFIA